jgi:hypothetical protein
MAKHRKRVRVFIWQLYWMPEGKPLKVKGRIPKRYRFNKRMRTAYRDGVGAGVALALTAMEVKAREEEVELREDGD